MYRIDSSSAVAELPAPASAGTPGFFTGGDPASGIAPTTVTADFLNMVQEELVNVVAAAGETPSKTDHSQLLEALKSLFMQVTDSSRFGSNANGYWEKRANGVIEQWGTVTGNHTGEGTYAITFPIAFTNLDSINVQAMAVNSDGSNNYDLVIQRYAKTLGGITFYIQWTGASSSSATFNAIDFRAIGL